MTAIDPMNDPIVTQQARDWIVRLSSGEITAAELAAYHRWAEDRVNKAVFTHELTLWRSLGAIGDRLAPVAPAQVGVPHKEPVPVRRIPVRRRMVQAGMAAAAVAIFAVATPEVSLRIQADFRTDIAVQSVTLPDGSQAVLDADSAIAIHYDDSQRHVELLKGRAWFEVAHGDPKPFRVLAQGAVVEDIGTAFEVSSTEGSATAAVSEGIVRVAADNMPADWLRLTLGQRATWSPGGTVRRMADIPATRIAAWREGEVLLDGAGIRAAVQEIARYRAGPTFIIGEVDSIAPVTAIVRTNRADEGLDAVAATAGLTVTRLPGGIAVVRPNQK